jgi:tripartite-type tricarboxylate transporter receptor subunit TctC
MKSKVALAAVLAALPLAVAAQPTQVPNFAGKTVTIVVGYKAGGGYDATARLLARYLPKHIPGKPTVIVQNCRSPSSPACRA